MENIAAAVALERSGNGCGPQVWMAAWRELKALGWTIDKRYPEPTDQYKLITNPGCDPISYKHYRDPETGIGHRKLRACFEIAYDRWAEEMTVTPESEAAAVARLDMVVEDWEHLHDYDPEQTLPNPIFDYWYRRTTTFLEQSGVRRFLLWLRT